MHGIKEKLVKKKCANKVSSPC